MKVTLYLLFVILTLSVMVACDQRPPPASEGASNGSKWLTSYEQAKEEAKARNKLLLLDFTGSDWCGPCIKLEREVFSKTEFTEYADKNLVLLEVDFPKGREQSANERKQNYDLQERFDVQGYPTIIVLDGNGKLLGQLGYEAAIPDDASIPIATPAALISKIEKLRKG